MKYLAILKDSIRETLDSKVLYVLMGMSLLVIVIVAGMTFEPQPASIGLISIFHRFPGAVARPFQETEPPLNYDVIELTQTEGEKNRPWEGAYRFTLIVGQKEKQTWPFLVWLWTLSADEKDMDPQDMSARKRAIALRDRSQRVDKSELEESFKKEIEQVSDGQMERFIAKQLSIHGSFEANQIQRLKDPDIRPSEYRFRIDARPVAGSFATWPHTWKWFSVAVSQDTSLGSLVQFIELNVVGTWGAGIAMLISSIITSFFVPNMVRKGTIDLFLTKPIRRPVLLIFKFIGGLTFMFMNTLVIVVGIWVVLGLRSGLWPLGFLFAIFILTFEFAIFYSVSTLVAVLTQSPIICILASCFTWLVLWSVGQFYTAVEIFRPTKVLPEWVNKSADVLHFITPRYKDLDILTAKLVSRGLVNPDTPEQKLIEDSFGGIRWGESLAFTTGFIVLILGLACWRFAVKDY
jgi:ABC-type transport system involved in multi-copper enzyme maturation permease subunit